MDPEVPRSSRGGGTIPPTGKPLHHTLRVPTSVDLPVLTEICLRSKAHWGYDAAFMAACVPVFTFSSDDLGQGHWRICDAPQGMAHVTLQGASATLDKLFIVPAAMGQGLGAQLFRWACATAKSGGAERLTITADPQALAFYTHLGAVQIGHTPSEVLAGRLLPVVQVTL